MSKRYFSVIVAAFALLTATLPLHAFAQTATTAASVTGTVNDESGAPIASASVTLKGPSTKTTASDATGAFSFADLTPGIYVLTVTKPGYVSAVQNDITLLGGQTTTLAVRMGLQTFSSLRTIASVRTNGHALNTAAASVNVVTTQDFINQAEPQVTRVLNQVPGIQISFPSNSSNGASPGTITVPNIRGATSYETASLIDGHPISVGQYGDNVTTFLNAFMFGAIEVVKGPGADSPEVNNAIGGTTNFRTKDPTLKPYAQLLYGVDNRGGTLSNFQFSDTIGRLGFVIDLATNNNPSALSGKQVYYDPSGSFLPDGTSIDGSTGRSTVPGTQSQLYNQPNLVACCYTLDGAMDQSAQLVKLRYRISNATHFTVSYLGGQTSADQNGNTSAFIPSTFTPGAGYTGSVPAGSIMLADVYPAASQGEFNNEPIFQGEFGTTLGKDSILARYYSASISRFQWGGQNPISGVDFTTARLYGTSSDGTTSTVYNGQTELIGQNDYYQEPELDKLHGYSFEYQHPLGENDVLSFSAEQTRAESSDYSYSSCFCTDSNGNTTYIPVYAFYSIPPGTHQELGTYLLRGHFYFGPKLDATLGTYFNTYSSTYSVNCPYDQYGNCTQSSVTKGTGITFATTKNTHFDPRLGLVYRPNSASSVRFSLGSSIAPPYLGQLSVLLAPASFDSTTQVATESKSNGNLKPETAFGYDLGGDVRLKDNVTVVSGDVYLTNLFNRFFGQTINTGLTCAQVSCNPQPPNPSAIPVLNQTNTNISNARFEGVELSIQRAPTVGFGYDISGALQKGYYYNLPPYFYCSLPGPGCSLDQNLNVISGQNTNGLPVGFYSISYNGNMRIPYAQGNAELNYTSRNGMYVAFGDTYYGKNNSLNRPPFGIAYATVRVPVGQRFDLQLSGDNIFNAYPGILPVWTGGVPIALYGGLPGATSGNVLGPATWRLVLSTHMP